MELGLRLKLRSEKKELNVHSQNLVTMEAGMASDTMNVEEQQPTYNRFPNPPTYNHKSEAEAQSRLSGIFVHIDASALGESKNCRCIFEVQIPFSNAFGLFPTNHQFGSSSVFL